jgi:hypothetical protein
MDDAVELARRRSMVTQTVRLNLKPHLRDAPDAPVQVHGRALPNER